MYSAGIDYHKRYSVVNIMDDHGTIVVDNARVNGNTLYGFRQVFAGVDGPLQATFECGRNWGYLYDLLEETGSVERIVPAHAAKVKVIGEAEIKTDKIDARMLAHLLRADLIPAVHVPDAATRMRKDVLRQRAQWVQLRTRVRNRVHGIIDRYPEAAMPKVSDLFGRQGMRALKKVELPGDERALLDQHLAALALLAKLIKACQRLIDRAAQGDADEHLLLTVPGMGPVIAPLVSVEVDGITRFSSAAKLCAYAGLVPSTYSSGGRTRHGRMLHSCNHWLKWAFIEASWVAMKHDLYFGGLYKRHRARGKKATTAITIVARRMCTIVYHMLYEQRAYEHRPLRFAAPGRPGRLLTESHMVA